ncbi:unnamed protein product [Amoebophrya sp. A120]|nr:unnamed protein product [Amoebophrya sp. A120]|eukprot:GSA120T00006845001.1
MTYGASPVAPPPPGAVLHNSSTSMLQHLQNTIDAHHPPAPSFVSNYEERLYNYDYQGLMHPQQSSTNMLQGATSQDFLDTTTTGQEQQGAGIDDLPGSKLYSNAELGAV